MDVIKTHDKKASLETIKTKIIIEKNPIPSDGSMWSKVKGRIRGKKHKCRLTES